MGIHVGLHFPLLDKAVWRAPEGGRGDGRQRSLGRSPVKGCATNWGVNPSGDPTWWSWAIGKGAASLNCGPDDD